MFRPSHLVAGAVTLAALACNDSSENFVHVAPVATIRFVNATDTPITIVNRGIIDSLNVSLAFGRVSACILVDLSNTTPTLTFTNSSTGLVITGFNVPLAVGANLTIIAFADTTGVVQFAGLGNHFTPTAGQAAIRFFNGAQPPGSLMMLANNVAVTPLIGFGSASSFANVPPVPTSLTFSNGTAVVLDAGTQPLAAGQTQTIVVGPATSATAPLRFVTVPAC